LVSHNLVVHKSTEEIRELQQHDAFLILLGHWSGDVGIPLVVNLDISSVGLPLAANTISNLFFAF
jgi:hypothetical protein